jgi:apolipoprotein N-acyltransferase
MPVDEPLPLMGLPGLTSRFTGIRAVVADGGSGLNCDRLPTRLHELTLAAASGVLLVLSFPKFGHPAFGWIALAPLLLALMGRVSLMRAFTLGLTTGAIYFAGTLYWMTFVMAQYGDLSTPVAAIINAAFVAYVALYPAIFALVVRRLASSYGYAALAAAPFVWTATELGRAYLFSGFPWALLGYSQATTLPIVQLASIVGIFGVSALVASASAALAGIVVAKAYRSAALVLAGTLLIAVWGNARVRAGELTREGQPIRVGLVQGNVDQGQKWSIASSAAILQSYLSMTRQAINQGAQLVIWPESSTPFRFEEDLAGAAQLRALARATGVPILFGSDQIDWQVRGTSRVPGRAFNSAFLVRADGSTGGVYRKMHLVPWGEYVPLKDLLFFVGPLVEAIGTGFAAGTEATLLPVGGRPVSVAICYEIIFPDLVRRFVLEGSELLTTITNDAWFGKTSAPYQHFEQASVRAIEEGRYLVRSANTGVSGIVDPYGRVVQRSQIFQPAVVIGEARLLTGTTIYTRIGDAFAYASAIVTIALLLLARRT